MYSRVGFGLMNGGFFLAFMNYRRQTLFIFVLLIALIHVSVATLTVFHQALGSETISPGEWRFGGTTNPVPFSEMLMASLGLVAIYLSGTIHGKQWLRNGLLLTICLGLGLIALVLTGTRGTFLALLPLALLMAANARSRYGWLYLLSAIVVLGGLFFHLSGSLQTAWRCSFQI